MRKKHRVWNREKELAAALIGAGRLSRAEVAKRAGVCERTVYYWQKRPRFMDSIKRHSDEVFEKIWEQHLADPTLRWDDMKIEFPEQSLAHENQYEYEIPIGEESVSLPQNSSKTGNSRQV